jgi:hypothetical protein
MDPSMTSFLTEYQSSVVEPSVWRASSTGS